MIITGSQRSGTMTLAHILGIQHEVQFSPYRDYHNLPELHQKIRPESSWMASPFVPELLKWKVPVIHLVRHPLKVIRSLVGMNFWTQDGHAPYRTFLQKFYPQTKESKDPIIQSMIYWYYCNKPLSQLPRIRLEDIKNAPQLNSRPRANVDWPDDPWTQRVMNLAEEYGYAT